MTIVERAKAPTSKFFRILRTIGLALLGISGSVMAAPVALPAAVVTAAGYFAVAGGVLSAVSQITVDPMANLKQENKAKNEEDDYHQPEGGKPDG
jgi:ABC-type xylose transport system permease subunit